MSVNDITIGELLFTDGYTFKAVDAENNELVLNNCSILNYMSSVFEDKKGEYSDDLKKLCSNLFEYCSAFGSMHS